MSARVATVSRGLTVWWACSTCAKLQITAGLRVKLSDAGKEYLKIWDREKGTHYLDEGVGTVVASGE
jgi:hypothetical protein